MFGVWAWVSEPHLTGRVHWGHRRPSFAFLHPSLCASSLRRSHMTIHTYNTLISGWYFVTPTSMSYSSLKTHRHPQCGLSWITFPPHHVTSCLPHFKMLPAQRGEEAEASQEQVAVGTLTIVHFLWTHLIKKQTNKQKGGRIGLTADVCM